MTKAGAEPRATDGERTPLSARALGIAFGIWITAMLLLAFVVVPAIFASCQPSL